MGKIQKSTPVAANHFPAAPEQQGNITRLREFVSHIHRKTKDIFLNNIQLRTARQAKLLLQLPKNIRSLNLRYSLPKSDKDGDRPTARKYVSKLLTKLLQSHKRLRMVSLPNDIILPKALASLLRERRTKPSSYIEKPNFLSMEQKRTRKLETKEHDISLKQERQQKEQHYALYDEENDHDFTMSRAQETAPARALRPIITIPQLVEIAQPTASPQSTSSSSSSHAACLTRRGSGPLFSPRMLDQSTETPGWLARAHRSATAARLIG